MNLRPGAKCPLVRGVDLLAGVDLEGEVLDPDAVVAMLAAVRGPEPEVLLAERR